MADLDGPRLEPRSGPARQLVVFLHGYGADGNDLIDIGRAWQGLLPQAAFVSPHAPEPCSQALALPRKATSSPAPYQVLARAVMAPPMIAAQANGVY